MVSTLAFSNHKANLGKYVYSLVGQPHSIPQDRLLSVSACRKSSKWNGAGPPDYTEGYGAMFDGINTNVCV